MAHSIFGKLTIIFVFALSLYYFIQITPSPPSQDKVKDLLQDRLSLIEVQLINRTDEIRDLKRIIEFKENDNQVQKKSSLKLEESLKSKASQVEELNNKVQNIEKKLQESNDKNLELTNQLNFESSTSKQGEKINKRFLKKYYSYTDPEYLKVSYIANNVNADLNEIIFMISIGHSGSYGTDRKFEDLLKVIKDFEFDKTKATLALLIGSKDEYNKITTYFDKLEDEKFFSKIIVVQSEFIEKLHTLDREIRHKPNAQKERRRAISRSRNFLLTNTLGDEKYSLCLDSDMIDIPKDSLNIFINSKKDIIAPRIRQGGADNYDFNSWVGKRIEPTPEEELKLDSNDNEFVFVPRPDNALHMHDLAFASENTGELDYSVELDSVGGAVLFVKSEIFKQGVVFPPFYLVGTKWNRLEGYDGIETEGLCYQAKTIGYSCWGMPNLIAWHTTEIEP